MNKPFRCLLNAVLIAGGFSLLSSGTTINAQSAASPFLDRNAPVSRNQQGLAIEVLSDTQGIDFAPYMKELTQAISKVYGSTARRSLGFSDGQTTLLSFSINREGRVTKLHLDESSHDAGQDRAAWKAIANESGLVPLPAAFTASDLTLRIRFQPSTAN